MLSLTRLSLNLCWLLPCALSAACEQGTLHPGERGDPAEGGGGTAGAGAGSTASGQGGTEGQAPKRAIAIPADGDGWVDGADNALGVQGQWTTSASVDSSLEFFSAESELCMTGVGAQALGDPPDRATYWGVAARLDLCSEGESGPVHTLGSCPWGEDFGEQVVGVRFSLQGTLPRELRVVFVEQDRETPAYVQVRQQGEVEDLEVVALFGDAYVPYESEAAPVTPRAVEAIEFYVSTSSRSTMPFDFCIHDLEVLTGEGWKAATLPDWALEPGPGKKVDYVGVNLAGAEFGQQNLPGKYGTDYIYPNSSEIDYYADAGMNVIRLPFRWERLQPVLGAALDNTELERIETVAEAAAGRGMSVILDPHNFARYGTPDVEQIVGVGIPIEDFADFWRRLAVLFADNDQVLFGLMNEPHDMETETWVEAANAAIGAIREAGADNLVLVPGNGWTGAHNWSATYYGTPNSVAMADIVDPLDHFAFEIHQYLDGDSSGSGSTCSSPTIGVERVQDVTEWLRDGGYRGFLGEFGAPANENCLLAMDELLTYAGENADVWMGWAVWAGGPWWGENLLTVEPLPNGNDRPQMVVLGRHLDAP